MRTPTDGPLRILLVHNHYRSDSPSGEGRVVDLEGEMLARRGHRLETFFTHSDELAAAGWRGTLRGALGTPWNPFAARRLRQMAERFRPHVIHVHNTFPRLSPAIFPALCGLGARVLTLHNYRLFCAAGVPLRRGRPCYDCLDRRSVLPALRHRCYRGGLAATLPPAMAIALHRRTGTWHRQVEGFIVLSEHQRRRMEEAGLPAARLHVKPHFFPRPGAGPLPWKERAERALYVGRLSAEKGVESLVEAWLAWGERAPELHIYGDGPLRGPLEARVLAAGVRAIRFHGQQSRETVLAALGDARLLVLPSICPETFGMAVIEAFAHATPVAAARVDPLPSLVRDGENGLLFAPGDPQDLLATVRRAWHDGERLERLGRSARRDYERRYDEEANYRMLMAIYGRALAERVA